MDVRAILDANAARLTALYGGQDQSGRYAALAEEFRHRFAREPEAFVSAPGRTEVVGNHTDHNLGRVLAAAVNLDTLAAVAPREGSVATLYSAGYAEPFVVDLSDLAPRPEERETTFALIRGVAARLNELGYRIGGFDAAVSSTVSKGSGLSSSAAFEVLIAAILDALYNGWTIDPKLAAAASKFAENRYFGKPSGLMDQMASAVGGLVTIDFLPGEPVVEALQYDFSKKCLAVCVVSAGGDHGDLTAEYASIPAEMKAVAGALGKSVLAEVEPGELMRALPKLKNAVPDRAILRAFHFIDETARVERAVDALRRDYIGDFLSIVIESGESSWKLLQNLYVAGSTNQEMPLALELSRRMLSGRGAWRIHGGGFAGTILAFVPVSMLDDYRRTMDAVFGPGATVALSIRPEGAALIRQEGVCC